MRKTQTPLNPVAHQTNAATARGESLRNQPFKASTFLANHALFRELGQAPLGRIAASTQIIEAPHGSVLFKQGDPCVGFHVIVYGQIKLALQTADGHEKVIELLGPGQSFGEAVMFLEIPYRVSAQTLTDSKLLHIDRSAVFAELDRDPQLARRIIASLSMRLHNLVGEIESQALQSGTQRVVGYLLSLIEDADTTDVHLVLPAKKNIIASRLNLTHEHFSRILHGLVIAEVIDMQGQKIVIPDVTALRRHAG